MPNECSVDRKLRNQALGEVVGTTTLPVAVRQVRAASFHEAPARPEVLVRRLLGRHRGRLAPPQQGDGELAHAADPGQRGPEVGDPRDDRLARGEVVGEYGP